MEKGLSDTQKAPLDNMLVEFPVFAGPAWNTSPGSWNGLTAVRCGRLVAFFVSICGCAVDQLPGSRCG